MLKHALQWYNDQPLWTVGRTVWTKQGMGGRWEGVNSQMELGMGVQIDTYRLSTPRGHKRGAEIKVELSFKNRLI